MPDTTLTGMFETSDGLLARIDTSVALRAAVQSTQETPGHTGVWVTGTGTVTVTNTGQRPNPAATAVSFTVYGGWHHDSRVCRVSEIPVTGNLCWAPIASATLYNGLQGPPLAVGQSVSTEIGGPEWQSFALVVPDQDVDSLLEELGTPRVVAVLTTDIRAEGSEVSFRGACRRTAPPGPSAAGQSPEPEFEQHVPVGSTRPVTCRDILN